MHDTNAAAAAASATLQAAVEEEPEASEGGAPTDVGTYDYLLSMPINSLTLEKVEALQSEAEDMRSQVARLRATTEKQMWRDDLDAFLQVILSGTGISWGGRGWGSMREYRGEKG